MKLQLPPEETVLLAALLSLLGEPTDPAGREAFPPISALLLGRADRFGRIRRLAAALNRIPPTATAVLRVAGCVQAWSRETGRQVSRERCTVDRVVGVMVQIPDPDAYAIHLARKGFDHLGAMFHENTLARTRTELRGVFARDDAAEGADDYWAGVRSRLVVIGDEDGA